MTARTPERTAAQYAFDPARALGWRNIGLDGLGCFLRSVEAVLLGSGYGPREVALGLAGPLDLVRRGDWFGPMSEFSACTVRWSLAGIGDGARQWPHIVELVKAGVPVVLMPDGFHWPGDDHEGRDHYHHHMVLAHGLDHRGLHLLDTDAPAAEGYARTVPVTGDLTAACTRYAVLERIDPPRACAPEELAAAVLPACVGPLAEDIAELRAFHRDRWSGARLPVLLAKGMDVLALGDVQPQLFLLGHALVGAPDEAVKRVATALLDAAGRTQKLGLLLLGLHRFQAEGIYAVAHEELAVLTGRLETLLGEICRYLRCDRPDAAGDGSRLEHRLRGETQWCFGGGRPLPELPLA